MQAAQQLAESIIQATAVLQNPAAATKQRTEAVQFVEQLKRGEIHSTVYAAAVLTSPERPLEVQINAYSLLLHLVRNRWEELSPQEQQQVTQLAYQHMGDVTQLGPQAVRAIKGQVAVLLAAVARQQGPDSYTALLPQLMSSAAQSPLLAEMCCLVLQYITEDITQFEERTGEWKRKFLAALLASSERVLPFVVELLQRHVQAGAAATQAGDTEAVRAHAEVVKAGLGMLVGFAEWAPLGQLGSSHVVDACAFFLQARDFQGAALAVLKQLASRKVGKEPQEHEAAMVLFHQVSGALLDATNQLLGRPDAEAALSYEGDSEDYGRSLVGVIVQLADNHWSMAGTMERRYALMQQMLGFTRHPYMQLSWDALGFWAALLKDAGVYPGAQKSPITSPREQQQQQGFPGSAAAPAAAGSTGGGPQSRSHLVPPECCQLLVQALAQQLMRLPVRLDDPCLEVPVWMDNPQEWKDFSSRYRGGVKAIVRGASKLAPLEVTSSVAQVLQEAVAVCSRKVEASAPPKQRLQQLHVQHLHMEAAVQLLEGVLPSVCEASVLQSVTGLKAGLTGLLQQLTAMRSADPIIMMQQSRGLEAFARFLPAAPELLVPMVNSLFDCMAMIPLESSGQQPPPAKVTPQWKDEVAARMQLAKVLVDASKEAATAVMPHLESLATRIQQMWEQGLLRQGEKVALYEGLMIAAAAGGAPLQAQLMNWLLQPLHDVWRSEAFLATLASPEAFAREYMAYEVVPDGSVVVGSRAQRWSLHHSLQLFERLLRQSITISSSLDATSNGGAVAAAGLGMAQAGQPGAAQQHPFTQHMEWVLVPITKIIRCLHGLTTPSMQAALAPLAPAFGMDPVERALRLGGERERDAAKKVEEDAGTLAGTNNSALRFWLRSIREGTYMIIAQVAQHVGAPFWQNPAIAQAVSGALSSHLSSMDQRHLRTLLRHAVQPLVTHCPPAVRPPWLAPVFNEVMPLLHHLLVASWQRVAAGATADGSAPASTSSSAGGAPGGSQGGAAAAGAPQQQQQQQRLSEEMVSESILRELSRDYAVLLVKVADSSSSGNASASSSTGQPPGGGASSGAGAIAATAAEGTSNGASSGQQQQQQETVLLSVWRYCPQAVQAMMATAVAGLCWPDAPTAGKLCIVCRVVAGLAEGLYPELEALVLPDMLRSAIISVMQVSTITIQTDVLQVIRQLMVTWLPKSAAIRDLLLQLPNVNPQTLAAFQQQLLGLGSEKEQRNCIKQLLAESAGEQARAVLNAVSKVPVVNVPEVRQKSSSNVEAAGSAADELQWDWSQAGIAV